LVYLGLIILMAWFLWGFNMYKLIECDFESNYKCEVIHAVGVLVPPTSVITVWFGTDND